MAPATSLSARAAGRASPFADVRPAVAVAAVYAAAIGVWLVAGVALPGGRWLAVHLFTLGVVSNVVVAFTRHFAETMLHRPTADRPVARLVLLNAGTVAILVGLPSGQTWLVGAGATMASAAVLWLYVVLRRMRRGAPPSRFAFVVRTYERACGAFLHGAVLGALLGLGVVPGTWFGGVRLAHLHTNVLGWAGLTLLATLVLFGPTILRTRMQPGADDTAARWLRYGATGLTVAVLCLVATGAPPPISVAARGVAAAGLAVFGAAAWAVCRPVLAAARAARRTGPGMFVTGVCVWLPIAVLLDVVVVATGRWWLLSALGVVVLAGVLGQAVLAALGYLAPMLRASGDARDVVRHRLNTGAIPRVVLYNTGVVAVAAAAGGGWPAAATVGWAAVIGSAALQGALVAWPLQRRPA